jgi:hypothetical protein
MEFLIKKQILDALGKYVETDFSLALNLFSSGNTVCLENVKLKKSGT